MFVSVPLFVLTRILRCRIPSVSERGAIALTATLNSFSFLLFFLPRAPAYSQFSYTGKRSLRPLSFPPEDRNLHHFFFPPSFSFLQIWFSKSWLLAPSRFGDSGLVCDGRAFAGFPNARDPRLFSARFNSWLNNAVFIIVCDIWSKNFPQFIKPYGAFAILVSCWPRHSLRSLKLMSLWY